MPEIKLNTGEQQKLDLSKFFDGQEAYIHLRKIDRLTRRKLAYYQCGGSLYVSSTNLDKLIEDGVIDKDENMTRADIVNMLPEKIREKCFENDIAVERAYLLSGVDPDNHNFTVEGEKIKLDVNFWNSVSSDNPGIMFFVLDEIKKFNGDFVDIKKKTEEK